MRRMLESINEIKDGESVSNAQAEKYNFVLVECTGHFNKRQYLSTIGVSAWDKNAATSSIQKSSKRRP